MKKRLEAAAPFRAVAPFRAAALLRGLVLLAAFLTAAGAAFGAPAGSNPAGSNPAGIDESVYFSPTSADLGFAPVLPFERPLENLTNPIQGVIDTALGEEEVVEIEDPESVALAAKIRAIEQLPPMRDIDKAAVNLAAAYNSAKAAPAPNMQENGRVNFFFGTMTPRIVCKPLRLTDIELEPGEKVRNVHISDSARWTVSGASSGEDPDVVHVIVKPMLPDIAANMLVHTDRRTYSIELTSVAEGQTTPFVGFIYPEVPNTTRVADAESWQNLVAQYRRADNLRNAPAAREQQLGARLVDPEEIYADYTTKIVAGGKKNVPWRPLSVYDAGGKTYILMPDAMQVTEAPVMYIKESGKEKLTNYRVEDNFYIVDRLFDIGILTVGKDRVAIYRKTPVGSPVE
jgi:type IV secretion system protein VirB9